jgi:hypothetical protein
MCYRSQRNLCNVLIEFAALLSNRDALSCAHVFPESTRPLCQGAGYGRGRRGRGVQSPTLAHQGRRGDGVTDGHTETNDSEAYPNR